MSEVTRGKLAEDQRPRGSNNAVALVGREVERLGTARTMVSKTDYTLFAKSNPTLTASFIYRILDVEQQRPHYCTARWRRQGPSTPLHQWLA